MDGYIATIPAINGFDANWLKCYQSLELEPPLRLEEQ